MTIIVLTAALLVSLLLLTVALAGYDELLVELRAERAAHAATTAHLAAYAPRRLLRAVTGPTRPAGPTEVAADG